MKVNYVIPGSANSFAKAIDSVDFVGNAAFDAQVSGEEGSTPLVLNSLAAGDVAPRGGELIIEGCFDVQLDFNILTGEDCDGCTTDTLVATAKTLYFKSAPGGGTISYELPDYFFAIGDITATLIDDATAATPTAIDLTGLQTEKVSLSSCWLPTCEAEKKVLA